VTALPWNREEMRRGLRATLESNVEVGLISAGDADEVAENIEAVMVLQSRGVITLRLADHLVETMGDRYGERFRKRHPEWQNVRGTG
jgi:hypothetical protein